MKRPARWLTGLTIAAGLTFSLVAAAKFSKTGDAKATFKAKAPPGLTIDGHTDKVEASEDASGNITITVDVPSLTTDLSARDEHMQKALESTTYKTITFVVARKDLKVPADGASQESDAKGKLTLHGVTKDVSVHYTAKNSGGTIAVDASGDKGGTDIDMTDYKIAPPTFLGVSVKPSVHIGVTFSVKD